MTYAIIPPLGQSPVQTSKERADGIAEEWLKLSTITKKAEDTTRFLMPRIENYSNPTSWAIGVDLTYECNISEGFNTGYLFTLYGQSTDGQERADINQRILDAVGGTLALSEITPSTWILYTQEELDALGWFAPEI